MTYPLAIAVVGVALSIMGFGVAVLKLRRREALPCPADAGNAMHQLGDLGREQVALLREVKDALVVIGAQLQAHADRQVVLGERVQAVHNRLDAAMVAMRRP